MNIQCTYLNKIKIKIYFQTNKITFILQNYIIEFTLKLCGNMYLYFFKVFS